MNYIHSYHADYVDENFTETFKNSEDASFWRNIEIEKLDVAFRELRFAYEIKWSDLENIMRALKIQYARKLNFQVSENYYFKYELTTEYVLGYAEGLIHQRAPRLMDRDLARLLFNDYQFKYFFSILSHQLIVDSVSVTDISNVRKELKAQYIQHISDYLEENYNYFDENLADKIDILGDSHATCDKS